MVLGSVITSSGNPTIHAQADLESMFGRKVDLTEKHWLKNPFSRQEILRTYHILYPLERGTFDGLLDGGSNHDG